MTPEQIRLTAQCFDLIGDIARAFHWSSVADSLAWQLQRKAAELYQSTNPPPPEETMSQTPKPEMV